jgi:hypothetical protein
MDNTPCPVCGHDPGRRCLKHYQGTYNDKNKKVTLKNGLERPLDDRFDLIVSNKFNNVLFYSAFRKGNWPERG